MMKDAWITAIGHERPGMNAGLPLREAQGKLEILDKGIRKLLE
jgi:hypothetical protein